MILFICFVFLLPFTFGYEATVECDVYNQRYPNLTLTKVYSENTTVVCNDICINYLCAVKSDDPTNNIKVYALGSGCQEDVKKNCEFDYIGFRDEPDFFFSNYTVASICVNNSGEKICGQSLPLWFASLNESQTDFPFGWDHISDIKYEPNVDGDKNFNESLNTIHPVTELTTTAGFETTTTSTTTTLQPDTTTTTSSTSTTTTSEPDTTTETTTTPSTTTPTTPPPITCSGETFYGFSVIFFALSLTFIFPS